VGASNDALALCLLADATVETARQQGQNARDARATAARQELQRNADARRREIRGAFDTAWGRCIFLAPVWLFLCFVILANNVLDNRFADGSYAVTTWTFILAVPALLVIDIAVGRGSDRWLVLGASVGFLLNAWHAFSRPITAHYPLDVSLFWLTGFLGVLAYLASALHTKQNGR